MAYLPLMRNDYVNFDDGDYVFANPAIAKGLTWSGLVEVWTQPMIDNYHPLTMMSHMLDVSLFGLHPAAFHLVSLLIHAACAVLLFLLLKQLFQRSDESFWVALIFAVHPLNVESVAWIAERKNVLSMLFMLITLHGYLSWVRGSRWGLVVTHVSFALGLLAKSMIVTLPCILLLLDWFPLARLQTRDMRSWVRALVEKWALWLMVVAMSWATIVVQTGAKPEARASLERMTHVFSSYGVYLGKLIWPHPLTVLYPYHQPQLWLAGVSATALVILTLIIFKQSDKTIRLGWYWWLGTLVPVCGIVPLGYHFVADRYQYLPMIGFWMVVVWGLSQVLRSGTLKWAIVATVALAFGLKTNSQARLWRDSETLFRYTLDHTHANPIMGLNLAQTYVNQGRYRDAMPILKQTLEAMPDSARATMFLGWCEFHLGIREQGLARLESASLQNPNLDHLWIYLGDVYSELGRWQNAIDAYQSAMERKPSTDTRIKRAIALSQLDQRDAAQAEFECARVQDPGSFDSAYNHGVWLVQIEDWQKALDAFESATALRLAPQSLYGEALALTRLGRRHQARLKANQVLGLEPGHGPARQLILELNDMDQELPSP